MATTRTRVWFCSLLTLALGFPQASTQSTAAQVQRPKIEINREPIPGLNLTGELVEILPGGIRKLGSMSAKSGMRVGETSTLRFQFKELDPLRMETKLLELSKAGIKVELQVIADATKKVLAQQTLELDNYQEALVELAASSPGNSRIGIRFIPSVVIKEPVLDYPVTLRRFALEDSILMVNSKEILSKGFGGWSSVDDLNGETLQFFTFENRRFGKFLLSYRPFPGATVRGYIDGRKMIFEWKGDIFEWNSMEKPIMPEGRWALYVAHEDKVSEQLSGDDTITGTMTKGLRDFK